MFQEIRILKGVVKNLEEELMKEKAKHQRAAAKRRKEYQDLMEEVRLTRISLELNFGIDPSILSVFCQVTPCLSSRTKFIRQGKILKFPQSFTQPIIT